MAATNIQEMIDYVRRHCDYYVPRVKYFVFFNGNYWETEFTASTEEAALARARLIETDSDCACTVIARDGSVIYDTYFTRPAVQGRFVPSE